MADPARAERRNIRVRSGLFEIDVTTGELHKSGRKVALQEQPFRVLAMLIERPGELVTRLELQNTLWSGDTYVGFEEGLNTAIRKLRLAFGDSADNPRFIETIPRRGYRFIGPVASVQGNPADTGGLHIVDLPVAEPPAVPEAGELRCHESGSVAPDSDSCLTAQSRRASLRQIPPATGSALRFSGTSTPTDVPPVPAIAGTGVLRKAVALALLTAAAGLAALLGIPTLPPPRVTGSTQLTNDGRAKETMVTDGARVYFSYSGYGSTIYQVSTAGGDTVPVETPIPVSKVVAISPDRSKLLVASCLALYENECPLWIVPVLGSSLR